jgi:hypothetical protein
VLSVVGASLGLTGVMVTPAAAQGSGMGVSVEQFMDTGIPLTHSTSGRFFSRSTELNRWGLGDGFFATSLFVATDGLTYTDPASGVELATAGGRVTVSSPWAYSTNRQSQWRGSEYAVTPGTTCWGSVLIDTGGWVYEIATVGFQVNSSDSLSTSDTLRIGKHGPTWRMESDPRYTSSGTPLPPEIDVPLAPGFGPRVVLMLFKFESSPTGVATVSAWLNPPLGGSLPPPSGVASGWRMPMGIQAIVLTASGDATGFDELRLGPTAASVLPRRTMTLSCLEGGDGTQYEVVATPRPITWTQARDMAAAMGGRLVDLNTQAEHDLVATNVFAREDVWWQYPDEWASTADYRGLWIGARRDNAATHNHASGWSWEGGQPWSFAAWAPDASLSDYAPGYDHAILRSTWGADGPLWMPTPDNGFDRVRGFVVEYPGTVSGRMPDVVIRGSLPATLTISATLPSGSTALQWTRDGLPMQDGWRPGGGLVTGVTTSRLEIMEPSISDIGEYRLEARNECGNPVSMSVLVRVDATNEPFAACGLNRIYRVVVDASGAVTSQQARDDAWSSGSSLVSILNESQQRMIDSITGDPSLWAIDAQGEAVGPWIGGRKYQNDWSWIWPDGNYAGWTNWLPGAPHAGYDDSASMYLRRSSSGTYATQWADMLAFEESEPDRTLPKAYVMEWNTPFTSGYQWSQSHVECGEHLVLEAPLSTHGVAGTVYWYGPSGLLQDGITAGGTTITGAGTTRLELSSISPADAGVYYPLFSVSTSVMNSCSMWGPYFSLTVGECTPACPADFNQDGGVDGGDIDSFFIAWESGDSAADVNQDGGVDGGDIDVFFAAWEAGGC